MSRAVFISLLEWACPAAVFVAGAYALIRVRGVFSGVARTVRKEERWASGMPSPPLADIRHTHRSYSKPVLVVTNARPNEVVSESIGPSFEDLDNCKKDVGGLGIT